MPDSKEELAPYRHTVQYYETDRMGIVHHSNYIRWMEEARADYLARLGFPFEKLEAQGIVSPVTGLDARYRKPCTFGDTVLIRVYVKEYRGIRLRLYYEIFHSDGALLFTGTTEHCFLDPEGHFLRLTEKDPALHAMLTARAETDAEHMAGIRREK